MQREELLTGLTLSDIEVSTSLKICKVCNERITNDDKLVFVNRSYNDPTWICIFCESIYDCDDNIIEIGLIDVNNNIKGYA